MRSHIRSRVHKRTRRQWAIERLKVLIANQKESAVRLLEQLEEQGNPEPLTYTGGVIERVKIEQCLLDEIALCFTLYEV